MLNQLLPRSIDNTYRGHGLAPWLLALLMVMKGGIGLNSVFNGHFVASSADGIPLTTFTPAGEQAVVSLFAIWGLSQVLFCLLSLLVLVRYRGMVSFTFALFLIEHATRKLIFLFLPIARTGTPTATFVNLVLPAVMLIGLLLSLWHRASHRDTGAAASA